MRIQTLQLENFRGFKKLDLYPNGKSVVIFGKNGTGKSSILRAIRYVISYIESKVNKQKSSKKNLYSLQQDDIYNGEKNSMIVSIFDIKNLPLIIQYEEDINIAINNNIVIDTIKKEDSINKEIFVYYGIDRYIYSNNINLKVSSKNIGKSIDKKIITSFVDYSSFVYWYREVQEKYYKNQNEKIYSIDSDTNAKEYDLVQSIMKITLDGLKKISYEIKDGNIDLIFDFDNGKTLKYNQLSDGEKTMISLFLDITMRLCENNKNTNCPQNVSGIVVIDEIEQHLHLTWQKTILKKLRKAFPNVQFIITTHSPIVLSETNQDYYLVGLKNNNEIIDFEEIKAVSGYDIGYIISKYFDTDTDSEMAKLIKGQFYNNLKENNIEKARKILVDWENISGSDNIDIEMARYDMEMRNK